MRYKKEWILCLEKHRDFFLENYNTVLPKVSKKEIDELKERMEESNYYIGNSYYDFLEEVNGLDYFGVMIFSDKNILLNNEYPIYGILEYNEEMSDEYVYFGVVGDELLGYTKRGTWILMDIVSGDIMDEYSSFDILLITLMKILNNDCL